MAEAVHVRAGQLLKIEVLDHVVMGNGSFSSPQSLGFFTNESAG
jgi:hypothetical protein